MRRFSSVPRITERPRIVHAFDACGVKVAVCRYEGGDQKQRLTCPDGQLWLALTGRWAIETADGRRFATRPLRAQFYAGGSQHLREVHADSAVMIGVQLPAPMLPDGLADVHIAHGGATQPYLDLIAELCRQDDGWHQRVADAALGLAAGVQSQPAVARVPAWLRMVRATLREPETLPFERLAARHEVNPAYLSVAFRKAFGETMSAYVARVRWARGLALLCDPSMAIGEVAASAGYYDHAHFTRNFRSRMRMTPREFREFVGLAATR